MANLRTKITMSNKNILYFSILIFSLLGGVNGLYAQNPSDRLAHANKDFQDKQFTESLEQYENLFSEGYYSETMLYRLAYMHENLQHYSEAIYYLKKAAQDFGNDKTEAKIKQMMQIQGSTRLFTSDGWNAYLQFFRKFSLFIWLGFGIAVLGIVVLNWLPLKISLSGKQIASVSAWGLFVVLGLVLFHRNFLAPERGVITEKTAFYDYPSYAGHVSTRVFSLGETVNILDEEDIWILVEAGGQEWWVPRKMVRQL